MKTEKWTLPYPDKVTTKNGEFTISFHAMQKFYLRSLKLYPNLSERKRDSIAYFYFKFLEHFEWSVECRRSNTVSRILQHHLKKAMYFVSDKWVFVVDDETNRILTCFPLEAKKRSMYVPINGPVEIKRWQAPQYRDEEKIAVDTIPSLA